MPIEDHDIFRSMLEKLDSIDKKFNTLDKNLAVLSPVITEQGRRITKIEDLSDTLRLDVNAIASLQREMKAQYKQLASVIVILTPIASVFISKWVG